MVRDNVRVRDNVVRVRVRVAEWLSLVSEQFAVVYICFQALYTGFQ